MISVTLTEWVRPPPVPLIVNVRVSADTAGSVSIVSVDVPEFTIDAGLNVFVESDGAPLTERFTVPEKFASPVIVTV